MPPRVNRCRCVVDMHGASMDRADIETISRFSELGTREGFVVVTPQALGDPPSGT